MHEEEAWVPMEEVKLDKCRIGAVWTFDGAELLFSCVQREEEESMVWIAGRGHFRLPRHPKYAVLTIWIDTSSVVLHHILPHMYTDRLDSGVETRHQFTATHLRRQPIRVPRERTRQSHIW